MITVGLYLYQVDCRRWLVWSHAHTYEQKKHNEMRALKLLYRLISF